MIDEKNFRHLLFDSTVIIGIITGIAYFSGRIYYDVVRSSIINTIMSPEVLIYDYLIFGILFFLISTCISFLIFNIFNRYIIKIYSGSEFAAIMLGIAVFIALNFAFAIMGGKFKAWKNQRTGLEQKEMGGNRIIEIELKSGRKVENAYNLRFAGNKDNFVLFLKDTGELVAINKDEILTLTLKNTSKLLYKNK